MFLQKLILENVQSHVKSEFDFSSGLNILTGISDVGKSSVIRALRSLYYVGGSTKALVRIGEKFLRITVTMSTGAVIVQERGETGNRYILREAGKTDQIFSGFRFDVPLEIARALGVKRTSISVDDAQELNLSMQIRGPFMLEKAGTAKAQFVGSLTRLDDIDDAIRDTNKDIVALNKEFRELEQAKTEIQAHLSEFSNLESLEACYGDANCLFSSSEASRKRVEALQDLKSKYAQLSERYSRAMLICHRLKDVIEREEECDQIIAISARIENLANLKTRYTELQKKFTRSRIIVDALKEVPDVSSLELIAERILQLKNLSIRVKTLNEKISGTQSTLSCLEKMSDVSSIETLRIRVDTLKNLQAKMRDLDAREMNARAQIQSLDLFLLRIEKKELEDLKKERAEELRKMGVCPTCGTVMTEESVARKVKLELDH